MDKHNNINCFLGSIFFKIKRTINSMQDYHEIYILSVDSDASVLTNDPYKYIQKKFHDICYEKNVFDEALSLIPIYADFGELHTRSKVLMRIASEFSLLPFVMEEGKVAIPISRAEGSDIHQHIERICTYFYEEFGVALAFSSTSVSSISLLTERSDDAEFFYLQQHGEWTTAFMANLGDDLSRYSFSSFLRQRIKAHIFENSPVCYPVKAPAQSARWRRQREEETYDFPILYGCRDEVRDFFYRDTFIYEQYAIPGIVEAKPGDIVIDAGAYIGDTACYFSRKVGRTGKVFAFEILSESVAFALKNMHVNDCRNVEIVPLALSDRQDVFSLARNAHCDSGTFLCASSPTGTTPETVHAVRLDDFLRERRCGVDFIKADVEGSEMSMLRGGEEAISKYAPICALSLYHRQNDYWEIPQFLGELCPDYTFWFRSEAEPVLFAGRLA